jgi:hypothetical protein
MCSPLALATAKVKEVKERERKKITREILERKYRLVDVEAS